MITFFLEGEHDKQFIKSILPDLDVDFCLYSGKKKKYQSINNFIKSLESRGEVYFFLFDTDGKNPEEKKNELKEKIPQLRLQSCFPVIIEIESWIRAGCSDEICNKYKIKKEIRSTELYTKEQMIREFNCESLISVMQEILKEFSIEIAKQKNNSFKQFYLEVSSYL